MVQAIFDSWSNRGQPIAKVTPSGTRSGVTGKCSNVALARELGVDKAMALVRELGEEGARHWYDSHR